MNVDDIAVVFVKVRSVTVSRSLGRKEVETEYAVSPVNEDGMMNANQVFNISQEFIRKSLK